MKKIHIFMLLAAVFAMAGCASSSSRGDDSSRLTPSPPTDASAVQILLYDDTSRPATTQLDFLGTQFPQRSYKIIALLTCDGTVDQEVEIDKAIDYRARQIGANAIVNAGNVVTHSSSSSIFRRALDARLHLLDVSTQDVFRAYAIVYTSKEN